MAQTDNKHDPSLPFFEMVERNLPEQGMNEDTQPINGIVHYFYP